MKKPTFPALAAVLAPVIAVAQLERLSSHEENANLARLPALAEAAKGTPLASHLDRARAAAVKGGAARSAGVLAARVAADFAEPPATPFAFYAVPAMSEIQRLADIYPVDGEAGAPVRIVAAGDEYEPGAFLVYPFADLGKVSFTLKPFKSAAGKAFPADALDLKVVKVWYQNGNGWYSYFGDTGFKLCPELLLNDEDLIRVDTEKKANYARLVAKDGTVTEHWLNPPRAMNRRNFNYHRGTYAFWPMREDFRDAKTLQPVRLDEGAFRSFILTAHVAKRFPAGLYKGAVALADAAGKALGEIPVEIRVLPFDLPQPKCYFDTGRDYLAASYSYIRLSMIMEENGGDRDLAIRQYEAILRDQVAHNQTMHKLRTGLEEIGLTLEIMKRAGCRTDILLGGPTTVATRPEMEAHAKRLAGWFDERVGHHNVHLAYGDEPGAESMKKMRPVMEAYEKAGLKFYIAGGDTVFYKAGHLYDWHNVAKTPEDDSSVRLWNQLDNPVVAWYAAMHVGPENPAYNRREYGLAAYLAGYSATCNYAHHLGPYNDDSTTYKPMVFAYGIYDGVIDTLQWEGYREGIDDIRYATLLKALAQKAAKSDNFDTKVLGRRALQFMATIRKDRGDLDAVRLEMAGKILELMKVKD